MMTPSSRPLPVKVDPGKIEQVIMNLAVNACDAMPSGGVLNNKDGASIQTALGSVGNEPFSPVCDGGDD